MAVPKKEVKRFVNLQGGSVTIFDEKRKTVTVLPYADRARFAGQAGVIFEVEGDHYAQFVSARGPLYPFPEAPKPVAAPVQSAAVAPAAPESDAGDQGGVQASEGGDDSPETTEEEDTTEASEDDEDGEDMTEADESGQNDDPDDEETDSDSKFNSIDGSEPTEDAPQRKAKKPSLKSRASGK